MPHAKYLSYMIFRLEKKILLMYKHPCNITEKQAKTAFCGKREYFFLQCYPDRTNCLDCDGKKRNVKKYQHFGNIIGICDTLLHKKISFSVLQIRTNTRNVLKTKRELAYCI